MASILDASAELRVILRKHHGHQGVRSQRIGEREHPLEVAESDAVSAIRSELGSQRHGALGCVAAHP